MAPARKAQSAEDKKSAWKKASDRGPHKATLPSGIEVTFVVPNSTQLIRADALPSRLSEIAIMAASYEGGAEGYLADMGVQAIREGNEEASTRLKEALKQGLELRDWLVSEMMVDPPLTIEDVASGEFPQADIEMLLAFAERRRNKDAKGVELPIVLIDQLAEFPALREHEETAEDLEARRVAAETVAGRADGQTV